MDTETEAQTEQAEAKPAEPKPTEPELPKEYRGLLGRTRQEALHYSCGACGALFGAAVHTSINVATDPELGDLLSKGELNLLTCSSCGASCTPNIPLLYHDPKARCFALLLPESLRHEELRMRARIIDSLMDDVADIPDYVRRVDVVFGTSGLLRLLDETMEALTPKGEEEEARRSQALERREAELEQREGDLVAREEDLHAKQEDLVQQRGKLERIQEELAKGRADLEREREALRALALELQREKPARPEEKEDAIAAPEEKETPPVPPQPEGRPQQEVDRWRTSDERTGLVLHEERALLLARLAKNQQAYLHREPELLAQMFTTPGGPLVVLAALPAEPDPDADLADLALYWHLDPATAEQRAILDTLAQEFELSLDFYDEESRPVTTWELRAPLAENVRLLLEQADRLTEETEIKDFEKAVETHRDLGADRLGRKQHNFSAESFRELPTPAAARLALGIVSYWSEPENRDYLIRVKSFPMTYWRAIRERVVRKAIEYGLHLGSELADFALKHKLAQGRKELLRTCLASFAEVSLRIKPSDLDPGQELENWRLLLADCVKEGVPIDVEIEELAAAAAKRAGVTEDETAAGGDLSLLSEEALLPLLTDRAQRRDAALELCERGNPKMAEPVYRAVCNMTRAEVARVIPAMIPLGKETAKLLVKGLKHRKSFVRQGCALGLGALKAQEGIGPLMEMLLAEPTTIWREASRALGDMGTVSLGALIAGVRNADGEGRERIAWALSQSALDAGCRVEVEAMAKGRDTRLARVAARALELTEQVRESDREVRGDRPVKDQTIVRRFTRQFFESMAGEVSELDEDDILEQEEVLDDNDILEEAVEVGDEDIIDPTAG
jgi:hypothetical protein